MAWEVATAREHESTFVASLLDALGARGFVPDTCALDKGYDVSRVHAECAERGVAPVIPLKQSYGVKRGEHLPPTCEHGTWTFAGADAKRKATKWRCPSGECSPASCWIAAEVGVLLDAGKAASAERRERVLVRESPERPLDGGATTAEALPLVRAV
jgi:Transposase DDE domain